jgi:RimJ/RimL family protein N-acetyltransferase
VDASATKPLPNQVGEIDVMAPVLETDRLRLRHWAASDEDALFAILSDPNTMRFWERPLDREQTRGWIARSVASYEENGFGRWAVERRDDDTLVGDAGLLTLVVNGRSETDLGYIIHHPFWRQGYAAEIADAVVRYAFGVLGTVRLVASMADDHMGSRRVAEKIGMSLETTFRNPRNRDLPTLVFALERSSR